jgi:hypothetical protein
MKNWNNSHPIILQIKINNKTLGRDKPNIRLKNKSEMIKTKKKEIPQWMKSMRHIS